MATVSASLRTGTAVDIRSRQFLWRSDEPPEAGGADTGPTPYEFLLGSLAACIAMTLRLYATHKDIPLTGVDVSLEFDRVHADDCVDCDERADGLIDRVQSQVTIHGEVTTAQRARLTQVAQRCPVHKTLAHGLHITDQVAFDDAAE
ncbi:MAG: osmotically inducible protein C [Acidobacteria bacterium]|jgi:putative redox protein|nr:osmotically inducible protein C [Acidobacteriota bacterium]MDP7479438.1 OsmC family protein [Vicinamibacterales bacterium]MDP7691513.1 OsmC family protein [Vicinamibacterales bacterium]HJN43343.1 OsmC family protein [Vicinamibacterales bacterium]|tara:strand:- start:142 stop:582 length:441 start_codon:yes stop_codon:yes gene_type:complete